MRRDPPLRTFISVRLTSVEHIPNNEVFLYKELSLHGFKQVGYVDTCIRICFDSKRRARAISGDPSENGDCFESQIVVRVNKVFLNYVFVHLGFFVNTRLEG